MTQLKLDKNRKTLLERKKKVAKQKNKHKEGGLAKFDWVFGDFHTSNLIILGGEKIFLNL